MLGYVVWIALLGWVSITQSTYTLKVLTNPSNCLGGEACGTQPQVAILNNGDFDVTFEGYVSVVMGTSPSGSEALYIGRSCDDEDNCGIAVSGSIARAYFDNSIAVFQDLLIKTAGSGYTLSFIAYDSDDVVATTVESSKTFSVTGGSMYKLIFSTFIGAALGGLPFAPNPVIAISDRGSNILSNVNGYYVTASIINSPNGTENLLPIENLRVSIIDGLASFSGLYINEAGYPYSLAFSSNLNLPTLISASFGVSVGDPSTLVFVNGTEISSSTIFAGEFFQTTPRIRILDAGGNLVSSDSSSGMKIEIAENPSGGKISSSENLFIVAKEGTFSVSAVKIDKVGLYYRLSFTFCFYNSLANIFTDSDIVLYSEKFNVVTGFPRGLEFSQVGSSAWGGGSPMQYQPMLNVVDYGGNIIISDFSSELVASMIPSLSVSKTIVVDSTTAITSTITSITTENSDGYYTYSDILVVVIEFSDEIWVYGDHIPQLELNIVQQSGHFAMANLTGVVERTKYLHFTYTINPGDTSSLLDYHATNSLHLHGATILDANNEIVTTTLPSPGVVATRNIGVNCDSPKVASLNIMTMDGMYTVGDEVSFNVTFDYPVVVIGRPYLNLTLNHASAHAYYTHSGDDNSTIIFTYIIDYDQSVDQLSINSTSIEIDGTSSILRLSAAPNITANYSLFGLETSVMATHAIVIDTTAPALNSTFGIQSNMSSGTFYVGDEITLFVKFNYPLVIGGNSITLALDCGNEITGYATYKRLLDDDMTLAFLFTVTGGVNTTALEIKSGNALTKSGDETYIRRRAMVPTMNANLSTSSIHGTLQDYVQLRLYGFYAVITNVNVSSVHQADASQAVLYPDDYVIIDVTFDTAVVVSCIPVFLISVGIEREAQYISGSGTNILTFQYIVSPGDIADYVGYDFVSSICVASGCPGTSDECYIKTTAVHNPTLDANLNIPGAVDYTLTMISNGNYAVMPNLIARNTTVTSIEATNDGGVYGPGANVYWEVTFTDEVLIDVELTDPMYPQLFLNTEKYALYIGGVGTKVLQFMYTTNLYDNVARLLPQVLRQANISTPIRCFRSESCGLVNLALQQVDLNMSMAILSNITVVNAHPSIVDVWTDKGTSKYNDYYTVGEEILIYVKYDSPVVIVGSEPRLKMDVEQDDIYAQYTSDYSTDTTLAFIYTVAYGDSSEDLSYAEGLLDSNYGLSLIYRQADIPLLLANYSLPNGARTVSRNGELVKINTVDVPHIVQVTGYSPDGDYNVADTIIIEVVFSQYVVLDSNAYINLNVGNDAGVAWYCGFNESNLEATLPTIASQSLYFKYVVGENHFNVDLEYIDRYSLFLGVNVVGGAGALLQAATTPKVSAVLDLPSPGAMHSLSYDSEFYVDGHNIHMTDIVFETPSGTYGLYDSVVIRMNFSGPVIVNTDAGVPYISMEVGAYDRKAHYVSGSTTNAILFNYTIEKGDMTDRLDYAIEDEHFNTARNSFQLNGGKIYLYSSNSSHGLKVPVRLNPIQGYLYGDRHVTSISGNYMYIDLAVSYLGLDYDIKFNVDNTVSFPTSRPLTISQDLYVSFSGEFSLRPNDRIRSNLIGWDVSIDGDLSLIGAPNSNFTVTAIQAISTLGSRATPVPEIQLITTDVGLQPVIEEFHTTAGINEVVGGTFSISYYAKSIMFGPTRPIPANVDDLLLQNILNYDLSILGKVTVKRTPYIYCACENAFTWQITFEDITSGVTDALIFDSSDLIGVNASVQGPFIIQRAAHLDGTFALTAGTKTSSYIDYDASAAELVSAIQELGLDTIDVSIGVTDSRRCRTWTVTFNAYNNWYDIPLLGSISSKLSGGTANIWHRTVREGVHGPTGLAGGFTLEWRGNTTEFIPYNATSHHVKLALENLDTIHEVNVVRSESSPINEFTWRVEFVEVYTYTSRGYILDSNKNIEPMIAHSYLIGTDVLMKVQSIYGLDTTLDVNNNQIIRQGTYGVQAGAAYVYQLVAGEWTEVAKLVGNDTNEYDQFGASVQLDNVNNLIVVGAIGADIIGVPEKQAISCAATEGYFSLQFRGWTSSQIYFNVSRTELYDFIVSDMTSFDSGLYGITFISINDWGEGNLCRNNTAVITFYNPVDGDSLLFNSYSDLELLQIVDSTLNGNITIKQVQKGTVRPHGVTSDVQQTGAVYVFRGNQSCNNSSVTCEKSSWVQEARFAPLKPIGGEQFGFSVAMTDDIIVVGAPGGSGGKGAVYVYKYSNTYGGQWDMFQLILINELDIGSNLGYSVAVHGRTLAMGAPGANNGVYIYKRPLSGGTYSAAQLIYPPKTKYPLLYGDRFGQSVAIDGNDIVVSASGWSGENVYLGTDEVKNIASGAVFLFSRASIDYDYEFQYKLVPSNVKRNDRFGFDVDIKHNVVVVGSVENYDGDWTPSKAVIEVKTVAAYNSLPLGGYFKLKWMSFNVSEYHFTSTSASSDATTSDGGMAMQTSRAIPCGASAAVVKNILEQDLNTGSLLVSRSPVDAYDGGYAWSITFLKNSANINLFEADASSLIGTDAAVEISYLNPAPPIIRSTVHVFKRQDSSANYIEQMFLSPFSSQPFDFCGWSLKVTTDHVIVGCPNRDDIVPDFNTGAAMVYDLSLLNVQFSEDQYYVIEGQDTNITIERNYKNLSEGVYFYVETLDRNAPAERQDYVKKLYGVLDGDVPYPLTVFDVAGIAGDAIGRTQYYGSQHNESIWIDGMYDYRGISDYVPFLLPFVMTDSCNNVTAELITTSDSILEIYDETVTMAIYAPGIWPSVLGDLHSTVIIEDDGDGFVNGANQYDKIYGITEQEGVHLGHTVCADEDIGVLFAGMPLQDVSSLTSAGSVIFYRNVYDQWLSQQLMQSPTPVSGGKYGDDIVVQKISKTTSALVIGEPGVNKVHVYSSYVADGLGKNWTYDATLSVAEASSSQDLFGSKGTVALYGQLLVVGAPGLEKIFRFIRRYDNVTAMWVWSDGVSLISSDYDYDVIHSKVYLHRQQFGKAVSMSGRTIAVGAPYADYNKLGSDLPEANWNTEGSDIFGYGRGKVYMFYSSPAVSIVVINSLIQLSAGSFVLSFEHNGATDVTSEIEYSATNTEFASILSALSNLETVEVSASQGALPSGGYQYTWTITFLSEWDSLGEIKPLWRIDVNSSYNCTICTPFDSSWSDPANQITTFFTESIGDIAQHQIVEASDKRSGNKFGWTIALENDQLVVGAIHSSSITSTSWDFEAGYLKGWSVTGDAFDYQPTYGDNSYYRPVDPSGRFLGRLKPNIQSSRMVGLYYIGTYEKRPGDSSNYMNAGDYGPGFYQGDGPMGTLTSDVFIIKGTKITFLIGGGCNRDTVFVELLIDGLSTAKHTGKCSERMDEVSFDLSRYSTRAAQIRIVDASTAPWGHINVDEFKFDWDVEGSVFTGVNQKTTHDGVVESPRSGAVYTFLRHANGSDEFCIGNKFLCVWEEEARLVATDKRSNTFFGSSLALNDYAGVLLVGSPYASFTGFYKETPSIYPYINGTSAMSDAAGITFPVSMSYMPLFQSDPLYGEIANAGKGIWELRALKHVSENTRMADKGGAVYVFVKEHAIVDSNGNVISPQHWQTTEHSKIQPPDEIAYDMFGTHISISGSVIAIGSTGNDGHKKDGGAIYTYNAAFAALSFSAVEYPVLEGTSSYASVTILRSTDVFNGDVYIEYATSDLSAQGVDSTKFAACMDLATNERGPAGCGDYEQTKGVLHLAAGSVSGGFDVRIMNDLCKERFMKYVQVTISVPGSAALQGEAVSCRIRIDDDDYLLNACS